MNENVALKKQKQKSFSKYIEQTKDKLKKGDIKVEDRPVGKITKSHRGVIYISNIPHGFYEKELKGYFGQFGKIIKVRVARSKKTGGSKGHAFVEFKDEEVAKIAAETMNNYLMGKRLLKAKLLPQDEKTKGLFKKPNFSKEHYPTKVRRLRNKKLFNAPIPDEINEKRIKNIMKHIKKVTDTLKKSGIDYDFTPLGITPKIENIIDDKIKVENVKLEEDDKREISQKEKNKENKTPTLKTEKKKIKQGDKNKTRNNKNKVQEVKQIQKKIKKKHETQVNKNKIVKTTKKPKKVQKLSDKKSSLIKNQIKSNDQIKIVKKKSNKTKAK